jgi:hypothetical protein
MKGVYDVSEFNTLGDPISQYGLDATFRSGNWTYTLMGMVVGRDTNLVKELILRDPSVVNDPCCHIDTRAENVAAPLTLLFTSRATFEIMDELIITQGSILLLHGASSLFSPVPNPRRTRSGLTDYYVSGSYEKANEFRAKLRAIFWVTQQIPLCHDLGEPLVERVFMSTLTQTAAGGRSFG